MHRSHLDYIIVGSTLYDAGINPPLVAAGVNLNFWPIGFFIRSVGAYFVKRNAKHDRLHALLLRRYVTYLIKRGQLQEFFIEGGRSRSGKMRPPKVGLLSIMTDAYLKGLRRDILFVPVSITYETVVEDKVYGDENTGKRKLKENAFSLLQASKIFRKSYGDVMLHFGNPMSVAAFRQNYIEQSNEENKTVVVELAHELTRNIRQQSHISLTSLAATALLLAPRYALPRQTLVAQIRSFALAIERLRKFDPSTGPFTPSLVHFLEGREIILDDLTRSGFVGVQECLGQELFFVPGQRRFTADFYKNSCSHVFSELGFLSLLALLKVELRSKESEWLYDLCAFDLLLISKQRFFNRLEKLIESMRQENELSPDSIQFASTQSPLFIPGIFLTQFQSLWWVHLNLAHFLAHNEGKTELRHATFVDTLQTNAKAGLYLGQLARSEASSQAALLAALDGMQQRGLVQIIESGGKPETLKVAADLSAERAFVRTLNEAVLRTLVQTSPAPES
jgi:glycerol-3-phosphate O-acyltransferase